MGKRHKARILALQALYQYDIGEQKLDKIICFDWINKSKISLDILLFAEELISGTIKHLSTIDQLIQENLVNWKYEKIPPIDRNILRFSVYALIFHKEIPFIVTINEAIGLAQKFGGKHSYRFVNGVLDGITKTLETEVMEV